MNKSLSGFGAGLLALGFVMSMSAIVARAGTLEDAIQRLNAQDAQGAYELLKSEERQRAGQPDFDYVLGLAAVDSGRGGEAVAAFERVLAVKPDHMQARAELGRAYLAINEPEAARREMATVESQSDIPPEVRETLNRYVRALDTGLSGGGTHIQSNVTLKTGFDSNVNNSTSDSRILIPAFAGLGFATLGGGATAQEDMFGEVSGVTTLTHGLSIDRKFIAELSASYRGNASEEQFNQANAGLNIGLSQNTPDWGTFTVLAQAQSFWVDGKPYRYTLGGLGQWSLTTKPTTASISNTHTRLSPLPASRTPTVSHWVPRSASILLARCSLMFLRASMAALKKPHTAQRKISRTNLSVPASAQRSKSCAIHPFTRPPPSKPTITKPPSPCSSNRVRQCAPILLRACAMR